MIQKKKKEKKKGTKTATLRALYFPLA